MMDGNYNKHDRYVNGTLTTTTTKIYPELKNH